MGLDIRYLVVTLVAVFLAFAVGVLVGAGLTSQASVETLSRRIEEGFKREFERYREELEKRKASEESLNKQIETHDKFLRASLPHVVHQRLLDKRIAIVHTTGQKDFPALRDELTSILEQAGATVSSVTLINSDREQVASDVLQRLAQAYQIAETGEQNVWMRLSQIAAKAIASGDTAGVVNHLHKAGFLQSSGDYTQPVQAVILVGGNDDETSDVVQRVDLPIIKTFGELGVTCVGCETTDVTHSFMEDYQRNDISTVDNVNTPMGQAALVLALAGYKGRFGTKATANALLPSAK